jgi:hypothetical protein
MFFALTQTQAQNSTKMFFIVAKTKPKDIQKKFEIAKVHNTLEINEVNSSLLF